MAEYAEKEDAAQTISFPDSFFKETFINVEWTIQEDTSGMGSIARASTIGSGTPSFV